MKFITTILSAFFCLSIQAQLVTYPGTLSTGMPHNDDYTVRVRIPGGEWKDLFEYNVQVDMDKVQDASMVQFDMGSPVEVMVKKNNGTVREVAIRPLSKGIEYKQIQNAILFTLEKPQYLSIEFNGDRLHNLHLFANPMETEKYEKETIYSMYYNLYRLWYHLSGPAGKICRKRLISVVSFGIADVAALWYLVRNHPSHRYV